MLHYLSEVPAGLNQANTSELINFLKGATVINVPSDNIHLPPVFISILLHGNEETGWLVIRELLQKYDNKFPRPTSILFGDLVAANASLRRFEDRADMNRIWHDGSTGTLSASLWELRQQLKQQKVAYAIDIHNTNGDNPPHAICVKKENNLDAIDFATGFSGIVLTYSLKLLTCMEAFAPICPTVTLECGKSGTTEGLTLAIEFVDAVLNDKPLSPKANPQFYKVSARLQKKADQRVDFGEGIGEIIFPKDADKLNFTTIPAGSEIAKLKNACNKPFIALDYNGNDVADKYLNQTQTKIVAKTDLMPAMIVPDRQIVNLDCLFYLLEQDVQVQAEFG